MVPSPSIIYDYTYLYAQEGRKAAALVYFD